MQDVDKCYGQSVIIIQFATGKLPYAPRGPLPKPGVRCRRSHVSCWKSVLVCTLLCWSSTAWSQSVAVHPDQPQTSRIARPDGLPAGQFTVNATLSRFPGGEVVWSDTKPLAPKIDELKFDWIAPAEPGVYQFDVVGQQKSDHTRWWPKKAEVISTKFSQQTYIVSDRSHESVSTGLQSSLRTQAPVQWKQLKDVDLSVASRKFAGAWQNFRNTISENSWFDIAISWPEIDLSQADSFGGKDRQDSPPTTLVQQTVLVNKLRSSHSSMGVCYLLPEKQGYQCDLPPIEEGQYHRLTIGFEPSEPVHLSLQWFRDGASKPIATKRVDFVPTVDLATHWTHRRYVYRVDGFCHLKIVNLDQSSTAKLSSIKIEASQRVETPASPRSGPRTDVATDDFVDEELRSFDVWVDDFSWSDLLTVAPSDIDAKWSDETMLAGKVRSLVSDLQTFATIWRPDHLWIRCPLASDGFEGTRLDDAVAWMRAEIPELRLIRSSTDLCHESLTSHHAIVGEFEAQGQHAQSLSDRMNDRGDEPVTVSAKFGVDEKRDYVVVHRNSNNRRLPLSLLATQHLVHRATSREILGGGNVSDGVVSEDSECWKQCIDAWRCWSNENVTEIESVDPSNQTAEIYSNARKQIAIANHAPWRTTVHLTWSNPPTSDLVVKGNGFVDQQRRSQCRLELQPGGLAVIQPSSSVRSWSATIAGGIETVDAIKTRVTHVVERVGMLSAPPLEDDLWRGEFSLTPRPPSKDPSRGNTARGSGSVRFVTVVACSTSRGLCGCCARRNSASEGLTVSHSSRVSTQRHHGRRFGTLRRDAIVAQSERQDMVGEPDVSTRRQRSTRHLPAMSCD